MCLYALACFFALTALVQVRTTFAKSSNDVYAQVVMLKTKVEALRQLNHVGQAWPQVPIQENKAPRHVLQKTFEVLEKLGRLREIKLMGPITIPSYPARKITPDEVYDRVVRLNDEVALILDYLYISESTSNAAAVVLKKADSRVKYFAKTPNDVYRLLWEISLSLDPVLGIRGFGPNDVYAQSLRVLAEITFIRQSQLLPMNIARPKRTQGKHPNHALQATYALLEKMAKAEANLWIEPVRPPEIPRRVIVPAEVYDALQVVLAECQRIKFRLGLERAFDTPPVKPGKTPDDIIQNLVFARRLMPEFKVSEKRLQFDRNALIKTPNQVFSVASHIYNELLRYKKMRGIQQAPRIPSPVSGLKPKHVFNKTLDCLSKVAILRQQMGLGPIAVADYPLREISPNEVYDLALRLDRELEIIYDHIDMPSVPAEQNIYTYHDKTPSDVFGKMWQISYLLDTLIGSSGRQPVDVFKLMAKNVAEIRLICKHLQISVPTVKPKYISGLRPNDVFVLGMDVLKKLNAVKRWAGMFSEPVRLSEHIGTATPNDVYNLGLVMQAEIVDLKLHLGINAKVKFENLSVGTKTPSHVYRKLEEAYALLATMIGDKTTLEEK